MGGPTWMQGIPPQPFACRPQLIAEEMLRPLGTKPPATNHTLAPLRHLGFFRGNKLRLLLIFFVQRQVFFGWFVVSRESRLELFRAGIENGCGGFCAGPLFGPTSYCD